MPSALTPHDRILVDGDAGFTPENGIVAGSGTPQDPYVVAGWDIDASTGDGVLVRNTNAPFVIRDVRVHSGRLKPDYPQGRGIVLESVSNGRVENATLSENWIGLDASGSRDVTLRGNRFEDDDVGISYSLMTDFLVSGNVMDRVEYGIQGASAATIVRNRINGTDGGLLAFDLRGTVASNEIASAFIGIELIGAETNAVVFRNNLSRNWIGMRVWERTIVKVFHNNFLYNRIAAIDDEDRMFQEAWDDGYPSGGNFWTDYAGVDRCSGVFQDVCPDPDGIGDTPYLIDFDSRDFYPFMEPFIRPNRAPILEAMSVSPATAIPGQDVTFRTGVQDPDGDTLAFTWDFGDGARLEGISGPSVPIEGVHAFGAVGTYPVTLTVDDLEGGRSEATIEFTVPVPGLLRVRTAVDVDPARGVPGTISVDGVPRSRWGLGWLKIAPGAHEVSFSDVPGYGTPAPLSVEVRQGETTEVVGTYTAYGFLRVMTDPPAFALILIDGIPRNLWGVWMALPPGTYSVSVGSEYEVAQVTAGATTVAVLPSAEATQSWSSFLRVEPNPHVPTRISIDGVPRNDWDLLLPLDTGSYAVSTSDVLDHASPDDVSVFVSRTGTTFVNPQFQSLGALRVTTDPPLAGTVFIDGVPANDWEVDLAIVGVHKVSFGPVPGYSTPFGQFVSVGAGEVVSVTGVYSLIGPSRESPAPLEAVAVDRRLGVPPRNRSNGRF